MPICAPAFTLADPDVAGPLTVFPILGPATGFSYRSYAEAAALGLRVLELPEGASVNELLVVNPLREAVLFYEGEEVRGAQQDRTLDRSVLVPAGGEVRLPVTCVEHGRWDDSRRDEAFTPAPVASPPSLRRMKHEAAAAHGTAASAQGEVWEEVARVSALHGAGGKTGALRDAFEASSGAVDELRSQVHRRDGQLGAICCWDGHPVAVDLVGRADVFAALHGPLVAGYAFGALEHGGSLSVEVVEPSHAQMFLDLSLDTAVGSRAAVFLGVERTFENTLSHGALLEHEGELVALTGYWSGG